MKSSSFSRIVSRLALLGAMSASFAFGQTYTYSDLGAAAGRMDSVALSINDNGDVVGLCQDSAGQFGCKWNRDGSFVRLGGDSSSFLTAKGFNRYGEIAGTTVSADGKVVAAKALTNGAITVAPFSGKSSAHAINSSGQVVGSRESQVGTRAFMWNPNGTTVDLAANVAAGTDVYAMTINDYGKIAGYTLNPDGTSQAFIWDADKGFRGLFPNTGMKSAAYGVNSGGNVVGFMYRANKQVAFVFDATAKLAVPYSLPGGDPNQPTVAYAINDSIQAVGEAGGRAFVTNRVGQIFDLNSVTVNKPSGCQLHTAYSVNAAGQIVGYALQNGAMRAFLLTPVTASTGFNGVSSTSR